MLSSPALANICYRFLLAQLHMDSLKGQITVGHIELALENLPRGIKGLYNTYDQAMIRIDGQVDGFKTLAKQILVWITHAKRALSTSELQHAIAVQIGKPVLDTKFLPEIEFLGSACAGLVTIDENSDIVRLVHYTTREYFEKRIDTLFPHAHTEITKTCITYLSFDSFKDGFCEQGKDLDNRLKPHVFYEYAAKHWGDHA
ncbi:ankyrin repeat protein, partial [Zopfia rhizophila CBS 207.26]